MVSGSRHGRAGVPGCGHCTRRCVHQDQHTPALPAPLLQSLNWTREEVRDKLERIMKVRSRVFFFLRLLGRHGCEMERGVPTWGDRG